MTRRPRIVEAVCNGRRTRKFRVDPLVHLIILVEGRSDIQIACTKAWVGLHHIDATHDPVTCFLCLTTNVK